MNGGGEKKRQRAEEALDENMVVRLPSKVPGLPIEFQDLRILMFDRANRAPKLKVIQAGSRAEPGSDRALAMYFEVFFVPCSVPRWANFIEVSSLTGFTVQDGKVEIVLSP
ncbi:unnamed protein product [Fusarium fujikuroi]|nr:unnamed protein product [Fusarium fujikuroi]